MVECGARSLSCMHSTFGPHPVLSQGLPDLVPSGLGPHTGSSQLVWLESPSRLTRTQSSPSGHGLASQVLHLQLHLSALLWADYNHLEVRCFEAQEAAPSRALAALR